MMSVSAADVVNTMTGIMPRTEVGLDLLQDLGSAVSPIPGARSATTSAGRC